MFSTPDLCDAHPDDVHVLEPILRTFGGREAFFGPAVTVSCHEDNSRVKDLVGTPGEGRVIVVDGGGSVRRALLGDIMGQVAADNGWAGLVIHGAVRDVEILRTIDLGVQALSSIPVRTERLGVGDVGLDVTFGGVTFSTGDWVYADANGVVVSAGPIHD
ncbi:MAG: ribonuclease regulator protein RraA [Frankiales bacterium]|nr:ribonuclease regulator protein RraA [Frankiales bacterium]